MTTLTLDEANTLRQVENLLLIRDENTPGVLRYDKLASQEMKDAAFEITKFADPLYRLPDCETGETDNLDELPVTEEVADGLLGLMVTAVRKKGFDALPAGAADIAEKLAGATSNASPFPGHVMAAI